MKSRRIPFDRAAAALTFGWARTKRGKLALRRAASALVGTSLLIRSRQLHVGEFDKVLVVAPHPDDGALGCGGAIALASKRKLAVYIIYVTDGGASHPNHPRLDSAAIAEIRKAEAKSAAAAMGVDPNGIAFLNAADGRLSVLSSDPAGELSGRVAEKLRAIRPDAVFLPAHDDASTEHQAAFQIVRDALRLAGLAPRLFEFPIWSWWNPFRLLPSLFTTGTVWRVKLDEVREAKTRAIACYVSQLEPLPPDEFAALPEGFAPMFLGGHEFFFEH